MVSIRDFSSNPRDHLSDEEAEEAVILRAAEREGRKIYFRFLFPVVILLSLLFALYSHLIDPRPILATEPLTEYAYRCESGFGKTTSLRARTPTLNFSTGLNHYQCRILTSASHDRLVILHPKNSSYVEGFKIYGQGELILEEKPDGALSTFFSILLALLFVGVLLSPFAPRAKLQLPEKM